MRLNTFIVVTGLCALGISQSVFAAYDTDALEGYWKFDETSGTAVSDVSGHNQTGTSTGTPAISSDVPTTTFTNARSLNFDGSNDYVTMGDVANLEVEGSLPFSISAWFNPNSSPGAEATYVIASKGTPSGKGYAFQYEQISGNFVINVSKYGVIDQRVTITELTTGTWYHLAAVQGASSVEYFVDGVSQGTYSNASAYNASGTDEFRIGSAHDGTLKANGLIDDVRVYSRALSDAEITQLAAGNHTTAIWDGSSDTNFETAANWNINAVPDPYTNILVQSVTNDPYLSAQISGASLTVEANASFDIHGFNFELTDSGELAGAGVVKLIGSESINFANIGTSSTGSVLYYGTGSYSGLSAGNSYHDLIINDGLVAYWDFDEGSGSDAADSSGHQQNGTVNSATWDTSPSNGIVSTNAAALSFAGANTSYVVSDHNSTLTGNARFL